MSSTDYGKADFTRIVRVRDVVAEADKTGDYYKVHLKIEVLKPTEKAGVVWQSNPTGSYNFSNLTTDHPPVRNQAGVYTFYGYKTSWDKADGGPLYPGYVYKFTWCYVIDGVEYTETETILWRQEYRNATPTKVQLTLANLKSAARKFLGSEPGTCTVTELCNYAMEMLYSCHDWSFLNDDQVMLDTRAGIDYIPLPDNFLRLNAIEKTGDTIHRMVKVTTTEMRRLRERSLTTWSNCTFYLVSVRPQDESGRPQACLEVFPPPAETIPNVYTLDFKRTPPALAVDGDVVPVPNGMSTLVIQAVRYWAAHMEGHEDLTREKAAFETLLGRFTGYDDNRNDTPNLGPINPGRVNSPMGDFPINPEADLSHLYD